MDPAVRAFVRERANECCEFCGLSQAATPFAQFHIEHIVARQHGGTDDPANLALACFHCNIYKGTNLSSIDPESGEIMTLFHPRRQAWDEHFNVHGTRIVGLTATGRATVSLLRMNTSARQQLRDQLGKQ